MEDTFNARKYIDRVYGSEVIELYEEDYGLNGLDFLLSAVDAEEVDRLLESYKD